MNTMVDIQGFYLDPNEFVPKEIAIQCENDILVILIQPPYPFNDLSRKEKKAVSWIEKRMKMYWGEGYVKYENYLNCIDFLKKRKVFVKGVVKEAWLYEKLIDYRSGEDDSFDESDYENFEKNCVSVMDLGEYNCPPFSELYKKYKLSDLKACKYHPGKCAYTNVQCLINWSADNKIFE